MNRLLIASVCSVVIFSSCNFMNHRVHGTGNVVTQSREFSNFSGAEVSGAIALYVKQDSAYSVKVEVGDNLQQYIIIRETNGILYIRQQDNTSLHTTGNIKVYITAPEFKQLHASGACGITGQNMLSSSLGMDIQLSGASNAQLELKSPKVTVDLSGACEIILKGETANLSLQASGGSDIKSFDLLSENTDVSVSGGSRAEVFGSVKIDANASGGSDVYCKGKGTLTKDESGGSNVQKVD